MSEQDMSRAVVEQDFLKHKKSVTIEMCKEYVARFHPEDKAWFRSLCVEEIDEVVKGQKTGRKVVRPFMTIKKEFYEKYFKQKGELSKRLQMFADWDEAEAAAAKK